MSEPLDLEELANIRERLNRPTTLQKTVFRIIAEADIAKLLAEVDRLRAALHGTLPAPTAEQWADCAEQLWNVVANVSDGNWDRQQPTWRAVARAARDRYLALIKAEPQGTGEQPLKSHQEYP